MGRAKVQLELIEDLAERNIAYHAMKKSLNEKARQLSILCGVGVLTLSVNPSTGNVESWSDGDHRASDILKTYLNPRTRRRETLDLPSFLKVQIRKAQAELKKSCDVLLPRVDDMMKSVAERIRFLEAENEAAAAEESLRQESIAYWQGVLQDGGGPAMLDQFEYGHADVFDYGLDTVVFDPASENTAGVRLDDHRTGNGNEGDNCTMNHGDHGDAFDYGMHTFVFNPSENSTGSVFRMGDDDEAVVPPAGDVYEWDWDISREPLWS